jgi:hypothetical protein
MYKLEYEPALRFDILYGLIPRRTIFPCQKCNKESCEGKKECKGFGAYSLGVKIK